jgi:hypothetical protein
MAVTDISQIPGALQEYQRLAANPQTRAFAGGVAKAALADPVKWVESQLDTTIYNDYKQGNYANSQAAVKFLQDSGVSASDLSNVYSTAVSKAQDNINAAAQFEAQSSGNGFGNFLSNPITQIGLAFALPGVGEAIAAALDISVAAGTAIAAASKNIAMGVDPEKAISDAALTAVVQTGSSAVANELQQNADISKTAAKTIANAGGAIAKAAATNGDIGQAVTNSLITSGVTEGVKAAKDVVSSIGTTPDTTAPAAPAVAETPPVEPSQDKQVMDLISKTSEAPVTAETPVAPEVPVTPEAPVVPEAPTTPAVTDPLAGAGTSEVGAVQPTEPVTPEPPADANATHDQQVIDLINKPAETTAAGPETPSGPGYYDEITGKWVPDLNGPLSGPLTDASGTNLDSMAGYTYDKATNTWTMPSGETVDLSYLSNTQAPLSEDIKAGPDQTSGFFDKAIADLITKDLTSKTSGSSGSAPSAPTSSTTAGGDTSTVTLGSQQAPTSTRGEDVSMFDTTTAEGISGKGAKKGGKYPWGDPEGTTALKQEGQVI